MPAERSRCDKRRATRATRRGRSFASIAKAQERDISRYRLRSRLCRFSPTRLQIDACTISRQSGILREPCDHRLKLARSVRPHKGWPMSILCCPATLFWRRSVWAGPTVVPQAVLARRDDTGRSEPASTSTRTNGLSVGGPAGSRLYVCQRATLVLRYGVFLPQRWKFNGVVLTGRTPAREPVVSRERAREKPRLNCLQRRPLEG